jgi:hypothetical protein
MPTNLEIASLVSLKLSAGQEILGANLKIALGLVSNLTTASIVYSQIGIGLEISFQFEAISVKQASVAITTDISLGLSAQAHLPGSLQVSYINSCRFTADLAPTAGLELGTLYACELQGYKVQYSQLLIGTSLGLVLTATCESACSPCGIPCYSSQGGY